MLQKPAFKNQRRFTAMVFELMLLKLLLFISNLRNQLFNYKKALSSGRLGFFI
jgi:hypothetical protein